MCRLECRSRNIPVKRLAVKSSRLHLVHKVVAWCVVGCRGARLEDLVARIVVATRHGDKIEFGVIALPRVVARVGALVVKHVDGL